MKYVFAILSVAVFFFSCGKRSGKPNVLVFTKTAGFHHASIPAGVAAIQKLGQENNFNVDTTSNADWIQEDSLKKYAAVVFLSTTGDILNSDQEADFERYIQSGGGFVGIHAAADAEYDWGWYGRMVGGYFLSHPGINDTFPNVQPGVLNVVDKNNDATKFLPNPWKRTDEFYSFKKLNKDVHVLLTIDENSYHGGANGKYHPMAWYHDYDGGRAWYTELGHTDAEYTDADYLKHILAGIKYAIGNNSELNYSKAVTQRVPDQDRFTKTQLVQGTFFEPTEMTILPNFDILVAQRRGELMLYKNASKSVKQAGFLNVYWKTLHTPGVNAEEGVLGLQADPDYAKNHYIYVYYSPADSSVNRLSRFTFQNDTVDNKTEKVILEVKAQREICCHTGGSIAFGNDHTLFFSAGDNSTPFDEPKQPYVNHGFAPLNDAPGHLQYDARRSAGNSNDLRGKIMRIHINDDGTYSIPDGNLFAKGTASTRPEIYVMGDRNPYRISVDKKTGFLYWGEVGPDANNDSLATRGPRGYDEVNQARKAGFFGWPFFVGNNYPYREYDYTNGKSGAAFDPQHPVNNSRNNTGLKDLPPAQPAFIWYPYAASPDFPQVGTGGRNAMAGPVYYTDMFPKETRYPDYYNGKLFTYDWIRGWIKPVTMQKNGDFDKMEPFMQNTKFNNPIDMEVGPDGRLYVLEYGSGWFSKNPDAGLSRLDYNGGNRPPQIAGIHVNKTSGTLPFTVTASVDAKDPEKGALTYVWDLGNGTKKETDKPTITYTYNTPGEYAISVMVSDKEKASAKSEAASVYAGNEAPTVNIQIKGNQTFYFPGKPVQYAVSIEDKDDTAKVKDLSSLVVSADYTEQKDKAALPQGHQVLTSAMAGKNLMLSLDCKSCHKINEKSIGPAYQAVSERYQKNPDAVTHLVQKMIKGGSGVWGEAAMPAHPNLTENDAREIVDWVLSLAKQEGKTKSLPASGSINPTLNKPVKDNGVLYLTASYTDKGGNNIKPLTGGSAVALRSSKLTFEGAKKVQGFTTFNLNGRTLMIVPDSVGSFILDSIDLTGINAAELSLGWQKPPASGHTFEVHLDSQDGQMLGEFTLAPAPGTASGGVAKKATNKILGRVLTSSLKPVNDGKLHTIVVVSKTKNGKSTDQIALTSLQFDSK